jgi:hypothetical protein
VQVSLLVPEFATILRRPAAQPPELLASRGQPEAAARSLRASFGRTCCWQREAKEPLMARPSKASSNPVGPLTALRLRALHPMVLRCREPSMLVLLSPARSLCSQVALRQVLASRQVLALHRELLPASPAEPARSIVRMELEPARPAPEPKVCMAAAADWE